MNKILTILAIALMMSSCITAENVKSLGMTKKEIRAELYQMRNFPYEYYNMNPLHYYRPVNCNNRYLYIPR